MEEYAGPLAYLQRFERHRCEFPFEELGTMAVVLRGWLDAGADQRVINDLEGLREAAERVGISGISTATLQPSPD